MSRDKEPADYIDEFYEKMKHEYPHISRKGFDDICRTNFRMLKTEMQNGSLRTVRLRYFGTFRVYRGRAIGLLNKTEKMFKDGKISEDIRDYIRRIVKIFLKREYNEEISPD